MLWCFGARSLAAIGIPAAVIGYRDTLARRLPAAIATLPAIGALLEAVGTAPAALLRDRTLFRRAVVVQLAELALDAGTLFVLLTAIGASVPPSAVFGSFVIATAVSRVVPIPMGLGTFEGSLVSMLRLVGVSIEATLTAPLLLRGFTLWPPMLPGLW